MLKPCWTCRSRTIQCDRSQTPCFKCKKAGLECHDKRPLRWVKGVAIRGKLRGHVFKGPSKTSASPQGAIPEKSQAFIHSGTHLEILIKPSFALQDPRVYNLDQRSKYYIDYYSNRICKLFILFDSGSNPFRNLLSIGLEDPTLRKSIIALAARHYANTGYSFDATNPTIDSRFAGANMDALVYKKQTIEALSLSLHQSRLYRKDQTMATILLLIFIDILESGIDGWNFHLQGAKGLLILNHSLLDPISGARRSNIDPGNMVQETRRFITDQFSLIETLGTSLYGSPNPVSEDFLCGEETSHQESIVRSFLGCPKFLLRAIQFFSNQRYVLAESKGGNKVTNNKNIQNIVMMLELTKQFDCFEWALTFQQHAAASAREVLKLCMLSQAYKAAALLYGNRVLGALETTTLNTEDLMKRLLGYIEALQGDTAMFKCLIWPVFIAGLDCSTESQQKFVLNSLRTLWGLTNCVNVISASNVLKDHWKQEEQFGSSVDDISDTCRLGRGMLLI
ncbi:hypothetical protein N7456_011606 [Penicillium angulare]|uniref:Zn(2)-C6 fungal-type domain-containing protein n=1 Tax=Penicillium angulare TaxID=116970 RepID=A0A9W9K089_9EURO|nr:hypothetical protein N7456_011606 [Penicillium angulare]